MRPAASSASEMTPIVFCASFEPWLKAISAAETVCALRKPLLAVAGRAFRNARPATASNGFRKAQTVSAALMAFSHGSNDAQKTMGVISLALLAAGRIDHFYVPLWVKLASALTIGLGTFSGGKRIIRTLGMKLVKLQPIDGFAAETAASAVLLGTAHLGFPVSTTHVITSSIMGVGATKRLSAVKWGVTFNILVAWLLTLPMAAAIAAVVYKVIALF